MRFFRKLFKTEKNKSSLIESYPIDVSTSSPSIKHEERVWFAESPPITVEGADVTSLKAEGSLQTGSGTPREAGRTSVTETIHGVEQDTSNISLQITGNAPCRESQTVRPSKTCFKDPEPRRCRATQGSTAERPHCHGQLRSHELTSPRTLYNLCAWMQKGSAQPLDPRSFKPLAAPRARPSQAPGPQGSLVPSFGMSVVPSFGMPSLRNSRGLWPMFGPDEDYPEVAFEGGDVYEGTESATDVEARHFGALVSNSSSVSECSETASFVPSLLSSATSTDSSVASDDFGKPTTAARSMRKTQNFGPEAFRQDHLWCRSMAPKTPYRRTSSMLLKLDLGAPNRYSGSNMAGPYPVFGRSNSVRGETARKRTSFVIPLSIQHSDDKSSSSPPEDND